MRWILSAATAALLLTIAVSNATASNSWTAAVSGSVVDVKSLDPVADATIKIFSAQGSRVLGRATSDEHGTFSIGGLQGGQYRLQFEKHGYQSTIVAGLYVRPGERYIEAAPIAMYPVGVPLPKVSVSNPCGSMVDPNQTADVYVICSGD